MQQTHIASNGNFGTAKKDLEDKGMRAFFKINSILRSQKVSRPQLSLKLFDTMVKPILTYGCQVWAQDLPQFDLNDISKVDKIPIEQVHNKQCKFILGINKYIQVTSQPGQNLDASFYILLSYISLASRRTTCAADDT